MRLKPLVFLSLALLVLVWWVSLIVSNAMSYLGGHGRSGAVALGMLLLLLAALAVGVRSYRRFTSSGNNRGS